MQGVEGVTADEEFLEGGVGEAGCKPDGDMGNGSRRADQESPREAVRPGRGECLARLRRLRGARGVDLGGPGHRRGPARRARLRPLPRCRLRSHHGATGTRRPQADSRSVPGIRHGAAGSSSRPRRRARGSAKYWSFGTFGAMLERKGTAKSRLFPLNFSLTTSRQGRPCFCINSRSPAANLSRKSSEIETILMLPAPL